MSAATTVVTITGDIATGLPIVAAGVQAAKAAKAAGKSTYQSTAEGIAAAATQAESLPNAEVDSFAGLAAEIASIAALF